MAGDVNYKAVNAEIEEIRKEYRRRPTYPVMLIVILGMWILPFSIAAFSLVYG
jgi:hypothetical protein